MIKLIASLLFLTIGISFGIASNSLAKISEGFSKLTPSILCILFMCIRMSNSNNYSNMYIYKYKSIYI